MASVSGIGGFCNRNPDAGPEKPAVRKERTAEPKPRRKDEEKQRAAPAQKPVSPPATAQPAPPPLPAATVQPQPAPPAAVQPTASAAQKQASFGAARALILSGKYEAGITSRPWATPVRFTSRRVISPGHAAISIASSRRAARRVAANIASSKA